MREMLRYVRDIEEPVVILMTHFAIAVKEDSDWYSYVVLPQPTAGDIMHLVRGPFDPR